MHAALKRGADTLKKTPNPQNPTFLHKPLPLSVTLQYLCAEPGSYIGFLALPRGCWPLPNLGSAGTGASSTPSSGAAGRAYQKQLELTRNLPEVKVSCGSPSLILIFSLSSSSSSPGSCKHPHVCWRVPSSPPMIPDKVSRTPRASQRKQSPENAVPSAISVAASVSCAPPHHDRDQRMLPAPTHLPWPCLKKSHFPPPRVDSAGHRSALRYCLPLGSSAYRKGHHQPKQTLPL